MKTYYLPLYISLFLSCTLRILLNVKNFLKIALLLDVCKSIIRVRKFSTCSSDSSASSRSSTIGCVSVWPKGTDSDRNAPILWSNFVKYITNNVR